MSRTALFLSFSRILVPTVHPLHNVTSPSKKFLPSHISWRLLDLPSSNWSWSFCYICPRFSNPILQPLPQITICQFRLLLFLQPRWGPGRNPQNTSSQGWDLITEYWKSCLPYACVSSPFYSTECSSCPIFLPRGRLRRSLWSPSLIEIPSSSIPSVLSDLFHS